VLNEEKARHEVPGFFFVDKRFEISNQSLIKDIENIIKMEADLPIII
jgi:hypothetical protein